MILAFLLVAVAVGNGLVGQSFCAARGRGRDGFWLGLFLGPVGWIVGLLLPESGPQCKFCLGVVAVGATRCRHCGSDLEPVAAATAGAVWFVARGEKVDGPFTPLQIMALVRDGKLMASDLCTRAGAERWQAVSEVV